MASGMMGWIEDHPDLALAGGAVGVLLIAGSFFKAKTPTTGSTTQDLSGLKNGIVYVPTQTSFITKNQSGVFASNDPALTSIKTGAVNSPVTTTTTTTNKEDTDRKWRGEPPPGPNPPPTGGKSLKWDTSYTIVGGDTLSKIAARLTVKLRAQGMPGSMSITWNDLYAHNTDLIIRYSKQHFPTKTDYYDWIFPGETITVPRWG